MTADQVVLVAPVGVAGRVGVVLEEEDLAPDPFLGQPLLGGTDQALQDSLPSLVVSDHVVEVVALRGGVLGMAADVQVEPRAVLEEHVRRAAPADHPPEEVARHLVGAQSPLTPQGAGHPVLVLDAEDASLHRARVPGCVCIRFGPQWW